MLTVSGAMCNFYFLKKTFLSSSCSFFRLRSAPLAIRFVTNTTKENKRTLLERLRKLQFDISEDEIFTSLTAARNLVEQKGVRPMLLVHDSALPDFKGTGPFYRSFIIPRDLWVLKELQVPA